MTIELKLSPETETSLREAFACHDEAGVRRLLADIAFPRVEAMFRVPASPPAPTVADLDAILDQVAEVAGPDLPTLSDEAVSREGIYTDRF